MEKSLQLSGAISIIGATSMVGEYLLPLLIESYSQVDAYSRRTIVSDLKGVSWQTFTASDLDCRQPRIKYHEVIIPNWICIAPIWVLPEYFALLEKKGARRVVALSSTSCFTKANSTDRAEQAIAARLLESEARLQAWAESRGVEWVILRPTLIYGMGRDKNIAEIARFINRLGGFPLFGKACGLRQPVHVLDVARACLLVLQSPIAVNRAYNISGGETLTYREMVRRVFTALGRTPRMLNIPLWAFRLGVGLLRCLPRYRGWSLAMAERMNQDLVFDHTDATRDFAFQPKSFEITKDDLPL